MRRDDVRTAAEITALWACLFLVSLLWRPLFPIDETRYAAVAWEMWHGGDWLVPHLNGVAYSHKPPLLFWLIGVGWSVVGAREWWARLVPALFALGGVYVTLGLGRALRPRDPRAATRAAWILFGTAAWALFGTVLMFDALVALFTATAVGGMVVAWKGRPVAGWALAAVSIGLGILSKGPVILVYTVPPALLAPWWARGAGRPWRAGPWYAGCAAATAGGAALALAWALPAAARGGPAYRDALLWGQTAHRVVGSFAHRRAWWAYLLMLPAMLAPWTAWVPAWSAVRNAVRRRGEPGIRLCLAWAVPALAILSLISGKQPHYLLPLLPAVALLLGVSVTGTSPARARAFRHPAIALIFLPGAAVTLLARSGGWLPPWAESVPWWPAALLVAGAAVLIALSPAGAGREIRRLAVGTVFALGVIHAGILPAIVPANDLSTAGAILRRAQEEGRPVANAGHYHGQFHFPGRLTEPIASVAPERIADWARVHPRGLVVTYSRHWTDTGPGRPTHEQPYRSRFLAIWTSREALREAASPSPRWE